MSLVQQCLLENIKSDVTADLWTHQRGWYGLFMIHYDYEEKGQRNFQTSARLKTTGSTCSVPAGVLEFQFYLTKTNKRWCNWTKNYHSAGLYFSSDYDNFRQNISYLNERLYANYDLLQIYRLRYWKAAFTLKRMRPSQSHLQIFIIHPFLLFKSLLVWTFTINMSLSEIGVFSRPILFQDDFKSRPGFKCTWSICNLSIPKKTFNQGFLPPLTPDNFLS